MTEIFISYASADRTKARALAIALESRGLSIFWDRTIPTGKTWRDVIGAALNDARCVVVLWSQASIESQWVQEEADDGREREILIPVLIESVRPPIGFRSLQTADLSEWDGEDTSPAFQKLLTDIGEVIGSPRIGPREQELQLDGVDSEDEDRTSTQSREPNLVSVESARTIWKTDVAVPDDEVDHENSKSLSQGREGGLVRDFLRLVVAPFVRLKH